MIRLVPSILAADFSRLAEQVREAEAAGADRFQVDVMDGHFVPNLSMGPVVVQGLRRLTHLPLEVHLMVEEPLRFLEAFLAAGADWFIAHREVLPDPGTWIAAVRQRGKRVGLAISPQTPVESLEACLSQLDLALCMTVHPGFGGQAFLPHSLERIRRLRQLINQRHPACELEVDGGLDEHTAPQAVAAGANVLVMGTAVFAHPQGPGVALRTLRALLAASCHSAAE
jgi:ribulose-phosphate 3-epimerase